jgi:hypothetical protein
MSTKWSNFLVDAGSSAHPKTSYNDNYTAPQNKKKLSHKKKVKK